MEWEVKKIFYSSKQEIIFTSGDKWPEDKQSQLK